MVQTLELTPPDLEPYRAGNTGVAFAHRIESGEPGPQVLINALTHGNELCGAIALDKLHRSGPRPVRGTLTLVFANVAAFQSFKAADPNAARYIDEDFNRLWDKRTLDGKRESAELARARALRPLYESAELLLDIHSMQHATAPLMLIGLAPKSERFARRLGAPTLMVRDKGHAAGPRLRDYAQFAEPHAAPVALLVECGQHWQASAAAVASDTAERFLAAAGLLDDAEAAAIMARPVEPQRVITVTEAVTIGSENFRFIAEYHGLEVIPKAGTMIARDGSRPIRTPYDDCVLIMPSRRLARGQTAVRLGRFTG